MKIPLVDVRAQYELLADEMNEALNLVLQRGDYILGKEVAEFEKEFASFCGCRYAVGVASGTDALHLALEACGVEPGEEVITSPNSFVATASAISFCGAKPVFVDIDPDRFTINPDLLTNAITEKTKAIIPVHLYGQPADMGALSAIAERFGLSIVEDACQAHGAECDGRRVGSLGRAAAFSFYPGKNLGGCGDGGAVTTNDPEIADRVKQLRNYGQRVKYHHETLAYNSRLDTIQAAILRVKLQYLDGWNRRRQEIAAYYTQLFAGCLIKLPKSFEGSSHVYHLYVIRTAQRDDLLELLNQQGIGAGIHYPIPIHLQPAYESLGYQAGDFPEAEASCRQVLSLPIHPLMTDEQIEQVAQSVKEYIDRHNLLLAA
ncbi:MAG: DegT/DnrJ/EryC1/StrS family aminotransferase [Armatimonadetes bacterium]|nr:DegT/DnrJ/EryC1/StrS family aminotransferase [Armatimonadota bacterium]